MSPLSKSKLSIYYILENKKVVPVDDVLIWARFFENNKNRRVGWRILVDGTTVSTVFLGIDHALINENIPVLFETMIFPQCPGIRSNKFLDGKIYNRYSTWDLAYEGHHHALRDNKIPFSLYWIKSFFRIYVPVVIFRRNIYRAEFYYKKWKKRSLSACRDLLRKLTKIQTSVNTVNLRRKLKIRIHEIADRYKR